MIVLGLGMLEWGTIFAVAIGCIVVAALVTDIFFERSLENHDEK